MRLHAQASVLPAFAIRDTTVQAFVQQDPLVSTILAAQCVAPPAHSAQRSLPHSHAECTWLCRQHPAPSAQRAQKRRVSLGASMSPPGHPPLPGCLRRAAVQSLFNRFWLYATCPMPTGMRPQQPSLAQLGPPAAGDGAGPFNRSSVLPGRPDSALLQYSKG